MLTKLTHPDDLWQPSTYVRHIYESSLLEPTLLNSGLVREVPPNQMRGEVTQGGSTITLEVLPSDLEGDAEALVSERTVAAEGVTSQSQIAAVFDRTKAWGIDDMATVRSGQNPLMNQMGEKFGKWLAVQYEKEIMALMRGLFGPMLGAADALPFALGGNAIASTGNAAGALKLSPSTLTIAKRKFGIFARRLKLLIVHPDVKQKLEETYSVAYAKTVGDKGKDPNIIGTDGFVQTWHGLELVESEAVDKVGTGEDAVYGTYISAPGVVITTPQSELVFKTFSTQGAWAETIQFRWSDVVHVDGTSWQGGSNITNGLPRNQLANTDNWQLVYNRRNVPIVRITTKL